jgi:hypothetical protein
MSNVNINIAAEFKGKKAFKEATTSTDKLTKNVKGLAKGLLAVYSAQKIMSYAKASVKAFAEDEKAAASLGQTLKNLGLAYGANAGTVNGFISRLEMQTGVLDDELRPAMDRLLRATGDVTKSQELLGLALDISAGTGKSLTQVSQSLQKAYLGQTQALGRLGVGLSKAELETSSFAEIQDRLNVLFAGQAATAADTYAGSLARLTVAGNNAKETIGKGLVDAFVTITNSSSVDDLVTKIDKAAQSIANFTRETGEFIKITKDIFRNPSFFAPSGGLFGDGKGFGNISMTVSSQDTQRADAITKKNQTQITKLTKEQAAAQAKILKDKKLQAAIDKANILLNKGTDVFDMDKIQNAAALTNQAEQLGKATTGSQLLQIANDTARLNVKKSILALEDAIASKDEAAIASATTKLNADLKILNTLTGQSLQMASIQSILAGLVPKDLVNQKNLDDALAKIREMLALLGKAALPDLTAGGKAGGTSGGKAGGTSGGLSGGKSAAQLAQEEALADFFKKKLAEEAAAAAAALAAAGRGIDEEGITGQVIEHIAAGSDIDAILEYADAATARANAIASLLEGNNAAGMAALTTNALANAAYGFQSFQTAEAASFLPTGNGSVGGGIGAFDRDINITVNTGVGDPNAIAEAIENLLREANSRGTLTSGLLNIG